MCPGSAGGCVMYPTGVVLLAWEGVCVCVCLFHVIWCFCLLHVDLSCSSAGVLS